MNVIDLYAGAGGASLGLRNAGLKVVAHVERDTAALATLRANAWDGVVGCDIDDLAGVSPPSLLRPRSPALPDAPVWWASCPCQPFSSAGDREAAEDERDGYPATLALVRKHRPQWLLLENVRGLTTHSKDAHPDPLRCPGCYFAGILDQLRELFPVVDHRILCAADYGVAQTRHRLIVVCGPVTIEWPTPTHSGASLDEAKADARYWRACADEDWTRDLGVGGDGCRPWETMRRALRLPMDARVGGGTRPHFAGDERRQSDRPAPTVPASSDGSGGPWVEHLVLRTGQRTTGPGGARRPHEVGVDHPAPTVRSQGGTGPELVEHPPWWYRATDPDQPSRAVGSRGNAAILTDNPLDHPAPLVSATEVKGAAMSAWYPPCDVRTPARASDALQHGAGRRRLTEKEVAVLQDFPSDYTFRGTSSDIYRQIGNAVPPRLAEVVARAVLKAAAS